MEEDPIGVVDVPETEDTPLPEPVPVDIPVAEAGALENGLYLLKELKEELMGSVPVDVPLPVPIDVPVPVDVPFPVPVPLVGHFEQSFITIG